ncbi:ABC transporter permease [Clostridium oryzae]|uniref:ABC-2 family transporter protein n=1 Tax=Clostridium oryzae TaxID=1450648 RepID=A0A1V4IG68_9CLOT|nr:ABC transporter permease subunit [Clostridium oryzae]OPJ58991.1 ABC-2 family transporter protein [Clostridium oryzae]
MGAILIKELKSYFHSATAYIFMGVFLFFSGIFYALNNVIYASPDYASVLSSYNFVFLLIVPILTMKIFAEETKTRTDQLLLTSPQSIGGIVMGKFLAPVLLYAVTLLITVLYPLILSMFGSLSVKTIVCAYIGLFLMGSCFISIGVFVSSLTENVVSAAVGTFAILLCLWLVDSVTSTVPNSYKAGIVFAIAAVLIISLIIYNATKNIIVSAGVFLVGAIGIAVAAIEKKTLFEGLIAKSLGWISLIKRNDNFSMGILSVNSIVYFISFMFIFVYLTMRIIEKRRWS